MNVDIQVERVILDKSLSLAAGERAELKRGLESELAGRVARTLPSMGSGQDREEPFVRAADFRLTDKTDLTGLAHHLASSAHRAVMGGNGPVTLNRE